MTNLHDLATAAAKGSDAADFLDHIAWTEVIEPQLLREREALMQELVQATLSPNPKTNAALAAGKIAGLDWFRHRLAQLIREGKDAAATMGRLNVSLAD